MSTINKDEHKDNPPFFTDDINLCSFLLTKGIALLDLKEDYNKHFVFMLSDFRACNDLKKLFINNALAPAYELFSRKEMLISEIKQKMKY